MGRSSGEFRGESDEIEPVARLECSFADAVLLLMRQRRKGWPALVS
jgi:hypothetical protein